MKKRFPCLKKNLLISFNETKARIFTDFFSDFEIGSVPRPGQRRAGLQVSITLKLRMERDCKMDRIKGWK